MSIRGSRIPRKLKNDAIIESLVELRFDTRTTPEFLLVKLAEYTPWKNFSQSRLPAINIPEGLRKADPNFLYQPTYELLEQQENKQRSIRIGPNVLSYHLRSPYNGWAKFGKEIDGAVEALFSVAEDRTIKRLGLRYLNALTIEKHQIRGITDLDVSIVIGENQVSGGLNINLMTQFSADTVCAVRVATPQFVAGTLPGTTTVVADIDVFTPEGFESGNQADVKRWVEDAHHLEKQEFFVLLKDETINALEDK